VTSHGGSIPQPEFPDDDGAANPALASALADPAVSRAALHNALEHARLIVPILAVGEESSAVDMATVIITGRDDRRGLLAFTSTDAMSAWDANARPVPVSSRRAALAALDEGCAAILLDDGSGRLRPIEGSLLRALAAGRSYSSVAADDVIHHALVHVLDREPSVVRAWVDDAPDTGDGAQRAIVSIEVTDNLGVIDLTALGERLGNAFANDDLLRDRLGDGLDIALVAHGQAPPGALLIVDPALLHEEH
jgi:SseB protein N-terminal domain